MNKLVQAFKDVFRTGFTDQEFHSFLDYFDKQVTENFPNLYHIAKLNRSEFRDRELDIQMYVIPDRDKNGKIRQIKATVHWRYAQSGHHFFRQRMWNFVSKDDLVLYMIDEFKTGLADKSLNKRTTKVEDDGFEFTC